MVTVRAYICIIDMLHCKQKHDCHFKLYWVQLTTNTQDPLLKIIDYNERKRHTARRLASTPSALLSRRGWAGGYPIPGQGGTWGTHLGLGYSPVLTWLGGIPSPSWGTPIWDWGTPLGRDLGPVTGVPPGMDMGPVEVLWDEDGVSPGKDMGSGSTVGWR